MANKNVAICIAGWHFNESFYAQVSSLPQSEVFVISHKPRSAVPDYLFTYIKSDQIFFEPNFGYDWGCYQQFLKKEIWRAYEYIFFFHDDVVIKDHGLIARCIELLNFHSIVGNGMFSTKTDHPNIAPQSYAHSSWKPSSRNFQHQVVRGSFFATTQVSLRRLGKFEVFWDPFRLDVGFGNWSVRASCGKLEYLFGKKCFGFLSNTYCESDYLSELERAGVGRGSINRTPAQIRNSRAIRNMCERYMDIYWKEYHTPFRSLALIFMTPFIRVVSGKGIAYHFRS